MPDENVVRPAEQLRAAILDDHPLMRSALELALAAEGVRVTTSAGRARQFLSLLAADPPDVALVDLRLAPSAADDLTDGHAVLQAMRASLPEVRPLVFSASLDPTDVERSFQNGACGYLYKLDTDGKTIAQAVRDVAAGRRVYPLASLGSEASDPLPSPRAGQHLLSRLTPREREVLSCLAAGYDNLKIGALLAIGERTVKTHVAAIYRKLQVENRVQAALLGRELGVESRN